MELSFHKGQRTLPQIWTNKPKQERTLATINAKVATASKSLAELHQFSRKNFSGDWRNDWHDLTEQWLNVNVQKRTQAVEELPLTQPMKDNILADWGTKRNEAVKLIQSLQCLAELEANGLEISQDKDTLICGNADALAQRLASVEVDEVAKEYWRITQNFRATFLQLQDFCKKHGLKEPQVIDTLKKDNEQSFVQSWEIGLFTTNPTPMQEEAFNDIIIRPQTR